VKHPQKLFIKGGHSLQPERTFMQTMTAFDLLKVRRLKRRLKASTPCVQVNSNAAHDFQHFDASPAALIHLKKPSVAQRAYRYPSPRG
jgi:hypothetical protein